MRVKCVMRCNNYGGLIAAEKELEIKNAIYEGILKGDEWELSLMDVDTGVVNPPLSSEQLRLIGDEMINNVQMRRNEIKLYVDNIKSLAGGKENAGKR